MIFLRIWNNCFIKFKKCPIELVQEKVQTYDEWQSVGDNVMLVIKKIELKKEFLHFKQTD